MTEKRQAVKIYLKQALTLPQELQILQRLAASAPVRKIQLQYKRESRELQKYLAGFYQNVGEAAQELKPEQRQVIRCLYLEGLSYNQTADKMFYNLRSVFRLADKAYNNLDFSGLPLWRDVKHEKKTAAVKQTAEIKAVKAPEHPQKWRAKNKSKFLQLFYRLEDGEQEEAARILYTITPQQRENILDCIF